MWPFLIVVDAGLCLHYIPAFTVLQTGTLFVCSSEFLLFLPIVVFLLFYCLGGDGLWLTFLPSVHYYCYIYSVKASDGGCWWPHLLFLCVIDGGIVLHLFWPPFADTNLWYWYIAFDYGIYSLCDTLVTVLWWYILWPSFLWPVDSKLIPLLRYSVAVILPFVTFDPVLLTFLFYLFWLFCWLCDHWPCEASDCCCVQCSVGGWLGSVFCCTWWAGGWPGGWPGLLRLWFWHFPTGGVEVLCRCPFLLFLLLHLLTPIVLLMIVLLPICSFIVFFDLLIEHYLCYYWLFVCLMTAIPLYLHLLLVHHLFYIYWPLFGWPLRCDRVWGDPGVTCWMLTFDLSIRCLRSILIRHLFYFIVYFVVVIRWSFVRSFVLPLLFWLCVHCSLFILFRAFYSTFLTTGDAIPTWYYSSCCTVHTCIYRTLFTMSSFILVTFIYSIPTIG